MVFGRGSMEVLAKYSGVAIYLVVLLGIGFVASRRMKDVRDFFAAGKQLGFLSVAFSARATQRVARAMRAIGHLPHGPTEAQGPQGPGATGPQGPTEATGAQGPQGPTEATGPI